MSSSQGPSHGAHDSEHTTSNDVSTTQSSQRDFGRFPPLIFNNRFDAFRSRVARTVYFPAHFVHDRIVLPLRRWYGADPVYYHRRFKRVPTIDQCFTDDIVCITEADKQFNRDRALDRMIVHLLERRVEECQLWERDHEDGRRNCAKLQADYDEALTNWFIKYGDLAHGSSVVDAYMKQKHRLIFERRYGPVGSGVDALRRRELLSQAQSSLGPAKAPHAAAQ